MISYKKTDIAIGVLGVLWEDRQKQRVDRRVLRVSKRVLRVSKRVLQVGQEYYEWLASNSVTYEWYLEYLKPAN